MENRGRIYAEFWRTASCQDTNKDDLSCPLQSSFYTLCFSLLPRQYLLWHCAVIFYGCPVWTAMVTEVSPLMPQRSSVLCARGFLYLKSSMQREYPLILFGSLGRLDCLTSRWGARWLNRHSWNFTCFLTQYCDKSFPYMFVFNLHCHSQVFPRQAWVLLPISL